LGLPHRRLNIKLNAFDFLELNIRPTGNYDLSVTFIIDGIEKASRTINLGGAGSTLNDTDFELAPANPGKLNFVLGGATLTKHKIPIGGCGRRLGMRFSNSQTDEDFEAIDAIVSLKPLGEAGEI